MESRHWFINAAGLLQTSLSPEELLDLILQVEQEFGRTRLEGQARYQDRTLDLDLLLFDELVLDSIPLTLPHPAMHRRWFVLIPLAEIAPQLLHPLQGKTIAELVSCLSIPGRRDVVPVAWVDS
jgi:2-amino-4-hydroxy-6-hydroxymethyldihydropteridine diphosphokinase